MSTTGIDDLHKMIEALRDEISSMKAASAPKQRTAKLERKPVPAGYLTLSDLSRKHNLCYNNVKREVVKPEWEDKVFVSAHGWYMLPSDFEALIAVVRPMLSEEDWMTTEQVSERVGIRQDKLHTFTWLVNRFGLSLRTTKGSAYQHPSTINQPQKGHRVFYNRHDVDAVLSLFADQTSQIGDSND